MVGFRDKEGEDIPVLCQTELSGECLRSRIRTGDRWIPCSLPGIRGGEGGWSAGFSRLGQGRCRLKPALRKRNRDKESDDPITALPLSYPAFAGAGIEPATNVIIQVFAEGGWSGMASSC